MKKRIIPSIFLKGGTNVCISQSFEPWRTVGALVQNLRLHINREADELLIINSDQSNTVNFQLSTRVLNLIRQEVDIPISYSGGIKSSSDAAACINAGFDKVYLTAAFLECQTIASEISKVIGSQSIGICLPYKFLEIEGNAYIWDYQRKILLSTTLFELIKVATKAGAGEILIFNVDKDGSLNGLDKDIVPFLEELNPEIPLLMAGGAGKESHISDILRSDAVQGVVASSIFALTQATPTTIRSHCENLGIAMRRT